MVEAAVSGDHMFSTSLGRPLAKRVLMTKSNPILGQSYCPGFLVLVFTTGKCT